MIFFHYILFFINLRAFSKENVQMVSIWHTGKLVQVLVVSGAFWVHVVLNMLRYYFFVGALVGVVS